MVMEKENWQIMPSDTIQVVSFAGLVGDGAALIVSSDNSSSARLFHENRTISPVQSVSKGGFSHWQESGNPFLSKLNGTLKEYYGPFHPNGSVTQGESASSDETIQHNKPSPKSGDTNHANGSPMSEEENEDLHADFIDEDSQLPSRISRPKHSRSNSYRGNDEDMTAQTASSLSLLR